MCDLIGRDQARTEEHEALVAALMEGENSGVSKRCIPEIVEAVKAALAQTA